MKTSYINIYLHILDEYQDISYSVLEDFPFSGIEERFDELVITFEENKYNPEMEAEMMSQLAELYPAVKIKRKESINDKNWNEEWEKEVPAIKVSDRIGIAPDWKQDELDTGIKIRINPKMSFGTGHHATTRLVCRLMDGLVKKDSFWIDAGTGTGILAILAVKLHAGKVMAFDNNIWSVENALENFKANSVDNDIELLEADIDEINLPECDGITANLFLHLAKSGLPKFYKALEKSKGDLLISGILTYDKENLIKAAQENGFKLVNLITEEEWAAFHFLPE
jgi:ribosomal protein L11 methyltransferase